MSQSARRAFGFLVIVAIIAAGVIYAMKQFNPSYTSLSDIFSTTVGTVMAAVILFMVLVALIRFLKAVFGRKH